MVRDLFVQRPSSRMHGIVIWLPMLEGDSPEEASRQARSWRDERVDQWWDADKRVSQRFQRALGLHGPAWDLYLLYRRGVRWDGDLPPSPTFWMHQIPDDAGADPDLCLDPARLSRRLDTFLQG